MRPINREAGHDADTCLHAGRPLGGDLLQAEVAGIILGGLDTSAQTCAFTLCAHWLPKLHFNPAIQMKALPGLRTEPAVRWMALPRPAH